MIIANACHIWMLEYFNVRMEYIARSRREVEQKDLHTPFLNELYLNSS